MWYNFVMGTFYTKYTYQLSYLWNQSSIRFCSFLKQYIVCFESFTVTTMAIVLSVLLRFTAFYRPFDIFKLFSPFNLISRIICELFIRFKLIRLKTEICFCHHLRSVVVIISVAHYLLAPPMGQLITLVELLIFVFALPHFRLILRFLQHIFQFV